MTDATLAYTALIFVNIERLEIAGEILNVLEGRDLLSAPSPLKSGEKISRRRRVRSSGDHRIDVAGTGSCPPTFAGIKQAVEYLIGQRRYYGYSPYTAKGPVVAALGNLLSKDAIHHR